MPIVPNFLERAILLTLNIGPGPMMDFVGGLAFRAVVVAVKLGVFEAIGEDSLTADKVARLISADTRATELLLEALEALGYVEKRNGRYQNSSMTLKWIIPLVPNAIGGMISGIEGILERWQYLDETIREGHPPILAWEWLDQQPGRWKDYQALMMGMAGVSAREIVSRARLPSTVERLLDLGGGHGLYSIAFCREYPGLSATIFDWPQAEDVAIETIRSQGMTERVVFKEGDFWEDDFGSDYDVALLSQIVHMYSPEKNVQLLTKVRNALAPDGHVVIADLIAVEALSRFARLMARLLSLELLNAVGGQTYAPEEIEGWLLESGFTGPSSSLSRKLPGFGVVVATKAA